MSKAILIMDMPIDCADCICSMAISDSSESGRCLKTGEIFDDWGKRQDWCPLQEMPELWEPTSLDDDAYYMGYNACIDEILGGKNEKQRTD